MPNIHHSPDKEVIWNFTWIVFPSNYNQIYKTFCKQTYKTYKSFCKQYFVCLIKLNTICSRQTPINLIIWCVRKEMKMKKKIIIKAYMGWFQLAQILLLENTVVCFGPSMMSQSAQLADSWWDHDWADWESINQTKPCGKMVEGT